MPSRDEVIYAYRLLLGREPESETVLNHYATELTSVQALRELFMNSPEFREKMANHLAPPVPRPSLAGPRMNVELNLSPQDLATLFRRTAAQWEHLGSTEPHWSVITSQSYLQEHYKGNEAAFYMSGEVECKTFAAVMARAGLKLDPAHTCLELGCGVGRVTTALARRFATVLGVDISGAHLKLAAEYNRSKEIANIRLHHLANLESLPALGSFDVLYSRIVLQHNPPPVIGWLLQQLLGMLRAGGVAFFQVPTYNAGYRFQLSDYLRQQNQTSMEIHYYPQEALLRLIQNAGCRLLELREDDSIGLSASAVSNTILVQKT